MQIPFDNNLIDPHIAGYDLIKQPNIMIWKYKHYHDCNGQLYTLTSKAFNWFN